MASFTLTAGEQELLAVLRHRVRLPILLALERDGELNAPQLAELLGVPYDTIYFALDKLAEAGLIAQARTDPRTQMRWFRGTSTGWLALREVLAAQAGA